jgi:hypothetical protein
MTTRNKIPVPLAPELMEKSWSARESWRVFGIMSEFVEATERLQRDPPGRQHLRQRADPPDHPWYQLTERIARQLSDAGFSVISGGGPGVMEAANKGAFFGRRSPSA